MFLKDLVMYVPSLLALLFLLLLPLDGFLDELSVVEHLFTISFGQSLLPCFLLHDLLRLWTLGGRGEKNMHL